ncbi:PIN domain nuclease [Streptomyces sp. enrichment culture]|uniref:PIN domain nuclease n=1 Tax=Streptomyces sp. enrichment culture TaxID=1795815 RepID=UPI003F56393E
MNTVKITVFSAPRARPSTATATVATPARAPAATANSITVPTSCTAKPASSTRPRPSRATAGWDRAAAAGLIATCSITELEFFYGARSAADRAHGIENMRLLFGWVPVDDRAYDRAWQVQEILTQRGQHRSAGPVDLVVAATAELQGLTLLHRDRVFECVAAVTGQALQWYGPEAGK